MMFLFPIGGILMGYDMYLFPGRVTLIKWSYGPLVILSPRTNMSEKIVVGRRSFPLKMALFNGHS